mmetsp:Transcript_13937/g.31333  ORF Transcript_13937/g.31333 Transcript_13937/m.31333 type:complete len:217 (+) Transcript_13937:66-716(+)
MFCRCLHVAKHLRLDCSTWVFFKERDPFSEICLNCQCWEHPQRWHHSSPDRTLCYDQRNSFCNKAKSPNSFILSLITSCGCSPRFRMYSSTYTFASILSFSCHCTYGSGSSESKDFVQFHAEASVSPLHVVGNFESNQTQYSRTSKTPLRDTTGPCPGTKCHASASTTVFSNISSRASTQACMSPLHINGVTPTNSKSPAKTTLASAQRIQQSMLE